MHLKKPICIWLEESVSSTLRTIISSDSTQFYLVDQPDLAEVIIFENDQPRYVRKTIEYKYYPQKCFVISETDQPTYFLPACYASNERGWLSHKRTQTIPYFISQMAIPNPFIDGNSASQSTQYLYAFRGGSTSWVRKRLFKRSNTSIDVRIEETNHYRHWNHEESYVDQKTVLQQQYADLIKASSFFLCPRGAGVSSIRLFEVMQAGRTPVIIADKWIPVTGIPWTEFALQVSEKHLSHIDQLIRLHQHEAQLRGFKARQAWLTYCAPDRQAAVLANFIRIIQQNRSSLREQILTIIFPLLEVIDYLRSKSRSYLKYCILNIFALLNREFPYSLNRSLDEQKGKT